MPHLCRTARHDGVTAHATRGRCVTTPAPTFKTMPELSSDSIFFKGSTHKVCQDYATHAFNSKKAFAAISDGCSGSPKTDIGSRLLLELVYGLVVSGSTVPLYEAIGVLSDSFKDLFPGLTRRCLDATVWYAVVSVDDDGNATYEVRGHGDGSFTIGNIKSKVLETTHVRYTDNAPEYPSNAAIWDSPERQTRVVSTFDGATVISGDPGSSKHQFVKSGKLESGDFLLLTSDGIDSFLANNAPVGWDSMIPGLTGFKSLNGEFVTRRLQMFNRTNEKVGLSHFDDLSVAGISLA